MLLMAREGDWENIYSDNNQALSLCVITGNGYMDGKELQTFIQELQQARKNAGVVG